MRSSKIVNIFKTFLSIIKINIIIIYSKITHKKIIFFYHPKKLLTLNNVYYLEELFTDFNAEYLVIYGHEVENLKNKNYHYFLQGYLMKYLFNVDIFFSVNVCDKFTNKSIKIYMHHDISTAPLIDTNKEKQLTARLLNYDYIFVPEKKSQLMFQNLFLEHSDNSKKNPNIMTVGYYKLDYLIKRIKSNENSEKYIVIAPSDYRHVEELTIFYDLRKIIKVLLFNTKYKIVFRPYPGNKNSDRVLKIKDEFANEGNFIFDISDNYFDIYSNSACLITDISGTAFTFAYATGNPVIFYSKKENFLDTLGFSKLDYFNDRKKIGAIAVTPEVILNFIKKLAKLKNDIRDTNRGLLNEIDYLGKSKERIKDLVDEIVSKNYNVKK
jgi:hypothetical protein